MRCYIPLLCARHNCSRLVQRSTTGVVQIQSLWLSSHRLSAACRQRHRAQQRSLSSKDDDSERYRALYLNVVAYTTEQLRAAAAGRAELLSLAFLQWLASRESEVVEAERAQLSELCGRLVAIREGIDAGASESLTAEAAAARKSVTQLPEAAQEVYVQHKQDESSVLAEVEVRKHALAKRQAALALAPEQAALVLKQVAALTAGIREQKQRSALQLMSRKQLTPADLAQGFGHVDTADRILQMLLELPSDSDRRQLLPEAFTPASEGAPDDPNATEDFLSTSPLRLLQAIDYRLQQWGSPEVAAAVSLPAGRTYEHVDEDAIMLRLRTDVLSFLE